jgi:WD40 repeat protein
VSVHVVDDSTLYSAGEGGILRWDLKRGSCERVVASKPGWQLFLDVSRDGRTALAVPAIVGTQSCRSAAFVDLERAGSRPLPEFGDCVKGGTGVVRDGIAATGDYAGIVRVGRIGGGPPHLLVGHEGPVDYVALSPDLRWVASTGQDNTLRLWPMPDLDEAPLHALPRDELLAKLRSLTNLRAVRDAKSPNGWTIELGRFPGWKDVPTW